MDGANYLYTCAQLSIAIVGFSAIAVALRQKSGTSFNEQDGYRIRMIIERGLMAAFLAMFPVLLNHFDISGTILWRISSGVLGVYAISLLIRRYTARHKGFTLLLNPISFWALFVTGVAIVIIQLLNAVGAFSTFHLGWYLLGLTWLIVTAGYVFGFSIHAWTRNT